METSNSKSTLVKKVFNLITDTILSKFGTYERALPGYASHDMKKHAAHTVISLCMV
jgi:hypothetical protein